MREKLSKPVPIADSASEGFWAAARAGVLVIQTCTSCGAMRHPPSHVCRNCTSGALEFKAVSGRGALYTFTISMQPFVAGFEESTPLAIGLVALAEDPSVRILGNIVETDLDSLQIDMPLEVTFEHRADGTSLPQWRSAAARAGGS